MVLLNNTNEDRKVDLTRFSESIGDNSKGRSVLTRQSWDNLNFIEIPAKSPMIIELMN